MPWFRELSAEDRSWIGLIVQAGIRPSSTWYRRARRQLLPGHRRGVRRRPAGAHRGCEPPPDGRDGPAHHRGGRGQRRPRRSAPADAPSVRDSILRYAREVAFATAEVYAQAAEMRGAWDARLEALVVDCVLRGEADETVRVPRQRAGLGVQGRRGGRARPGARHRRRRARVDRRRRPARPRGTSASTRSAPCRATGWSSCSAAWTTRTRPVPRSRTTSARGRWSSAPSCRTCCTRSISARAAAAGLRAAAGWPEAPRPVTQRRPAPRAGAGRRRPRPRGSSSQRSTARWPQAGSRSSETLTAYLDHGGSIEGTARALFVHAEHRALPAQAGGGADRALARRTRGTPSPTGWRSRSAGSPDSTTPPTCNGHL